MLLRRVAIENVLSFLDRAELILDGSISILIGPNGGGKTNLLDAIVIVLRRHLFASVYAAHAPTPEQPNRYEFRANDALNNMVLERHRDGPHREQIVEVEIGVTGRDLANMQAMKDDALRLSEIAGQKYGSLKLQNTSRWKLSELKAGDRLLYCVKNGRLEQQGSSAAHEYLEYLNLFEVDSWLRDEFELATLSTPMLYLPVNRSMSGFQSSVQLAGYSEYEQKRQNDAAFSRTSSSVVPLAVGRLAQKYRLLLEKDTGGTAARFKADANLKEMTSLLEEPGYKWDLVSVNPLKNEYDLRLEKQGSSFLVGRASSGERELLTYLFAIFALNVKDAIIIVDEPELHLHPTWQKTLLQLFIRLAKSTNNQFLLATHSPAFVSPASIQYVSRVFSRDQKSRILRLDATALPDARHLFSIVNSQNNERIFFADEVVLVEGLSDRIFFEAVLDHFGRSSSRFVLELISVGGKGLFDAYRRLLGACQVGYSIVADLDYSEEIGGEDIKSLFKLDVVEIKKDVIDNVKSVDGATLVARIDEAIRKGSWADAEETWAYIKGRRRKLRNDLNETELATLRRFLQSKRNEQTYVLERGALEAYLPAGYQSKDLQKLISLVTGNAFWDRLAEESRKELNEIAGLLLRGMRERERAA